MELDKARRYFQKECNGWWLISMVGAGVILLPILYVFLSLFQSPNENWIHIRQYLLQTYTVNTIILVTVTGLLTAFIGVLLAWLIASYDFPFKRFFRFTLIFPLAIPPYIAAYTYRNMLSYTGVVQSTLRNQLDIHINSELLTLTSVSGSIFIFTFFLYPYVYLITLAFLEKQSAAYIENARMLGQKPVPIFFKIILPLSRPAIIGGVVLVVYEVLSDYGVTSYFGVHTFTTAIFQTWFGMYDVDSAMRLASWLMIMIVGLVFIERLLRKRRRYHLPRQSRSIVPVRLKGGKAVAASLVCGTIVSIGFFIPVIQLLAWAGMTFHTIWDSQFFELLYQTVYIAVIATAIILVFSTIIANVTRSPSTFSYILSKIVTAGYSIPGAIIAIGVLALFILLDGWLAPVYEWMELGEAPLILSLSLVMLVVGYVIRYMAMGYNAMEVGFEKVGNRYTESSRMLGHGKTTTFFKVELPLLKGALLSGFLLTFIEIFKELPLALLLRPFNFETLATKTYQYANDERIYEAAIPSLIIIAVSVLSVIVVQLLDRRVKE
ncbi:ABC transporter permease [Oceanobacillus salinisoli]|uniref:ABC transporter permease n=1 Tax=Oceanobacillus salinisoli TaxID=2678611 RepID=UPI0012E2D72B|nr:iron ABC transporter permease [Oceanobacillus salinisoli]